MWRNVFGHSFYQAVVLMLIIFLGEGWLVKNYDKLCVNDGPDCVYNPYFTQVLYEDLHSQEVWHQKNLKFTDYDLDLLQEFSCDYYKQTHDYDKETFDC